MTNCTLGLLMPLGTLFAGLLLIILGGWFVDYVIKVNVGAGGWRTEYARILRRSMGWIVGVAFISFGVWRTAIWFDACGVQEPSLVGVLLASTGVTFLALSLFLAVRGRRRIAVPSERVAMGGMQAGRSSETAIDGRVETDWAGRGRVARVSVILGAIGILAVMLGHAVA